MRRVIFCGLVIMLLSEAVILAAMSEYDPIADAGLARYAAEAPVVLDGTSSSAPAGYGPLTYEWRQISGPSVVITDSNTATPSISGFVQTNEIQECEFELVVSDGELISLPDMVKVIIVPDFGASTLQQENPPFDPNKPTVIYFGGGDCVNGSGTWGSWYDLANVISSDYGPDTVEYELWHTYYQYGDMIIVYLSSVAPDYKQPIQTIGFSAGADPAIDVGIRLNRAYADVRYAVNHVTHLDDGCRIVPQSGGSWGLYTQIVQSFLSSSVDGEQCWIEFYYGTTATGHEDEPFPPIDILWVSLGLGHSEVRNWYRNSLAGNDMNNFNSGVVAGAYWSVIGPGKNLQLAPTDAYYFRWNGTQTSGSMGFFDEGLYPGRLPEPVTLAAPNYVQDARGYILTCEESQNAVGYELLIGSDPYRVMDYEVISDTPAPPNEVTKILPPEGVWWTVRVREEYGSTIYADPEYLSPTLDILDVSRNEKLDFGDFAILAQYWRENESSVDIAPGPLGDGKVDAIDVAALAQYWLADLRVFAHWKLDEMHGAIAHDSAGNINGIVHGDPNWLPTGGKVRGALELDGIHDYVSTDFVLNPADGAFSVFAWVKGGSPGQAVISQASGTGNGRSWLTADSLGRLMTDLRAPGRGSPPLISEFMMTDGDWHRIGAVWDGSYRYLYADGAEVKKDDTAQAGLLDATGGLYFGTANTLDATSFFDGLIDDIQVYDQAITP